MLSIFHSDISPLHGRGELHSKYEIKTRRLHNGSHKPIMLGKGSYGKVVEALDKTTQEKVAIKEIQNFSSHPIDCKRVLREISILRILKGHPSIVTLKDIPTPTDQSRFDEIYLVFTHYQTNLHEIIKSRQQLTIEHVRHIAYQLLCGIFYIHSAKIIHRDLKPANILINSDSKIAIADFGLARVTEEIRETTSSMGPPQLLTQLTGYMASRWYRSPELLFDCPNAATYAIDMWGLGCIIGELLERKPLFPGHDTLRVLDAIFNFIGTPQPENYSWIEGERRLEYLRTRPSKRPQNFQEKFNPADISVLDLLKNLLQFDPAQRFTAEQALHHPFLSTIFNLRDKLTFPLGERTAEDQSSLNDYVQFETELEQHPNQPEAILIEKTSALILREITRYARESYPDLLSPVLAEPTPAVTEITIHPEESSPPAREPRSLISLLYRFFFHRPVNYTPAQVQQSSEDQQLLLDSSYEFI